MKKSKKRKLTNLSEEELKNMSLKDKLEYSIDDEIVNADKHMKSYSWIIEFSKKVVSVSFVIFILSTIASIYMIYMSTISGELMGIDTFITETNQTFRIVVGSYCIKAAFENVVKITGSKYSDILKIKNKLIEYKLQQEGVDIDIENTSINNDEDYEFTVSADEDCTSEYDIEG